VLAVTKYSKNLKTKGIARENSLRTNLGFVRPILATVTHGVQNWSPKIINHHQRTSTIFPSPSILELFTYAIVGLLINDFTKTQNLGIIYRFQVSIS
jgi:hypothetical protein